MKVIPLEDDSESRKIVLETLAARRFVAISIDENGDTQHHRLQMAPQEAIFLMELLKIKLLNDELEIE